VSRPGRRSSPVRPVGSGFAVARSLARYLPESAASGLVERLADRVSRSGGTHVTQLRLNLRRAAPRLSSELLDVLTSAAVRSYLRYWYEVMRISTWTPERLVDAVVTSNERAVRTACARSGAVVALPHMANWDHAGAWAVRTGMPVTAVAERLEPPARFAQFAAYREQLGLDVIALDPAGSRSAGADPPMWSRLRSAAVSGRLVCLVADRDLVGRGIDVELLGEPARLPIGPAALAATTGTTLFAATLAYEGPLLRIDFSDPINVSRRASDVGGATQAVAHWFTRGISRSPEDWHMMQPVFTADVAVGGAG
jgi:KDO2-lipid IV(A) lauroyltransferase